MKGVKGMEHYCDCCGIRLGEITCSNRYGGSYCSVVCADKHESFIIEKIKTIEPKQIPLIKPNMNFENTPMETIEPVNLNPLTVNRDNITMKCEEIASLLIKKNHDYGNSVQEQFKDYGLTSILIRLEDKVRRLKHLQKNKQQVNDESLIDTLDDLAGYAVLGSLCLEIEKEENKND